MQRRRPLLGRDRCHDRRAAGKLSAGADATREFSKLDKMPAIASSGDRPVLMHFRFRARIFGASMCHRVGSRWALHGSAADPFGDYEEKRRLERSSRMFTTYRISACLL